jgi:hypothetical protein
VDAFQNFLPLLFRCLFRHTGFYFELFVLTGLFALFINPNVTSLYRDRLSKAFLFNPNLDQRDILPTAATLRILVSIHS